MNRLENARLAALCAREMAEEGFGAVAVAEIELAVVEVVNNCIEHACAGSEGQSIVLELALAADRFTVVVSDWGKAAPAACLEALAAGFDFDPADLDNLPEGGMGLKLIKNCMDEVYYDTMAGRNRWTLVKHRAVGHEPAHP